LICDTKRNASPTNSSPENTIDDSDNSDDEEEEPGKHYTKGLQGWTENEIVKGRLQGVMDH
jgi:hypothetical protein